MENKFHYSMLRYGDTPDNRYECSLNPSHHTDKFIMKDKQTGHTYACKFFNWDSGFVGASLLAIYEMNEHFDLNIIDKDFKGETYEEHLGI